MKFFLVHQKSASLGCTKDIIIKTKVSEARPLVIHGKLIH